MINCFICGTWIKMDKNGYCKCPKCKAKWTKDKDGIITRIYDNYKDYIEK